MANVVRSSQYWTHKRLLEAGEAQGRRPGRLPGGHVGDLSDLKKSIALCGDCLPKFNQSAAGYVTKSNLPFVSGRCDGCDGHTQRGHLLVHHTLANLT